MSYVVNRSECATCGLMLISLSSEVCSRRAHISKVAWWRSPTSTRKPVACRCHHYLPWWKWFVQQKAQSGPGYHRKLGCTKIVFCWVFHRRQGLHTNRLNLVEYNQKVDMLNEALKSLSLQYSEVEFWDHSDVVNGGLLNHIWHADGVHLASSGTKYLFRSICGAVWTATEQLLRYLYNGYVNIVCLTCQVYNIIAHSSCYEYWYAMHGTCHEYFLPECTQVLWSFFVLNLVNE